MTLEEIIQLEPEIGRILDGLHTTSDSNAQREQLRVARPRIDGLVGWTARHPRLRNLRALHTVHKAMVEKVGCIWTGD